MFRMPVREGVDLIMMEERHADEIYQAVDRNRDHLRPWLPWVDQATSAANTLDFIRQSLQQFANNRGFAAAIRCEGRCAGTVGFHKIDWPNRRVEIGYWVARDLQGKGLATAASRVLVNYAFDEYKLNRVEIHCATGNVGSNKVARRLGFHLDGTRRDGQYLHGRFVDLNEYGVLAREWKPQPDSSL